MDAFHQSLLSDYLATGKLSVQWKEADYQYYLLAGTAYTVGQVYDRPDYPQAQSQYDRPDAAQVTKDYRATHAAHPYMLADDKRIGEIKLLLETDPQAQRFYQNLLQEADETLDAPPVPYAYTSRGTNISGIPDSGYVYERVLSLGLAYRLSGREAYARRAIEEIENVLTWPEWGYQHGAQFLSTGRILAGVALCYDWFHAILSEAQKAQILQSLLVMGVRPGLFYHQTRTKFFTSAKNNWNVVCANGLLMAALCTMEIEPALSAQLIAYCVGGLECFMPIYEPKGDYEEGPHYWKFGTSYFVNLLCVLADGLGTVYRFTGNKAFAQTAYYAAQFYCPGGMYNFHDCFENAKRAITDDEMFWFYRTYQNPDFYRARLRTAAQREKGSALALIWYPGEVAGGNDLPLDYFATGQSNIVGTGIFRSSWDDEDAFALGFHAGKQKAIHGQYDVGSFIIDALGERWALDTGDGRLDTLNIPGGRMDEYFLARRPFYYRMRAEGHNTLVIDPDLGPGQTENAEPVWLDLSTGGTQSSAKVDMTSAYAGARCIERTFTLDRANRRITIEDELALDKPSAVYWFIHTRADIAIEPGGKSATLSIGTKTITVHLAGDAHAVFEAVDAVSMSEDVVNMLAEEPPKENLVRMGKGYQVYIDDMLRAGPIRKLRIRLADTSSARISVQFQIP